MAPALRFSAAIHRNGRVGTEVEMNVRKLEGQPPGLKESQIGVAVKAVEALFGARKPEVSQLGGASANSPTSSSCVTLRQS